MADCIGCLRKAQRRAILRVTINAVRADLFHQRGDGLRPGLVGLVRSFVPHHHGEEHAHTAAMEVSNHLAHAFNATGHGLDHLKLVAVVDAHVGIRGPDKHRVDSAVALFKIVEVPAYGVAAGGRVVEVSILDHHLRLYET